MLQLRRDGHIGRRGTLLALLEGDVHCVMFVEVVLAVEFRLESFHVSGSNR